MLEVYREYHYVTSEQRKLREAGYAAITYTDHSSDGRVVDGTEDFSLERWKAAVAVRAIYAPTGEVDKGGHRRWEQIGTVYARNVKSCGKIARLVYPDREISVRRY